MCNDSHKRQHQDDEPSDAPTEVLDTIEAPLLPLVHLGLIVVDPTDSHRLVQVAHLQDVHYGLQDQEQKHEAFQKDSERLELSQLVVYPLDRRLAVQLGIIDR